MIHLLKGSITTCHFFTFFFFFDLLNIISRLSALSSHLFLIAVLVPADGREDQEQLNILLHSKLTVGRTVSSLYTLRDLDGTEGAFFVFSDISVRAEGNYKLRMCLFDIRE